MQLKMKPKAILLLLFIFLASCATTKTFPVSDIVPAAEIKVKQKTNNNDNENGEDSELETVTSFKGTEFFITAEAEAGVSMPQGVEISRVKL